MKRESWYLIFGALLVVIALTASAVKRWPLTTTMLYLLTGVALGPLGFGIASLHPINQARLLEQASELDVIVSLFTAGLKLRAPFHPGQFDGPPLLGPLRFEQPGSHHFEKMVKPTSPRREA